MQSPSDTVAQEEAHHQLTSQTSPFSRHCLQSALPVHLIFFRRQFTQAAVTRPDKFCLWFGSLLMKWKVWSACTGAGITAGGIAQQE